MLKVEDWAGIRRLYRSEGLSISQIARVLWISRNTVRSALAKHRPPKYQRPPAGSVVDAVEPRIRELLARYPTMPSTVIAERIGWTHSIRTLSGRVAQLRPMYLPPEPAVAVPREPVRPGADGANLERRGRADWVLVEWADRDASVALRCVAS